MGEGQLAAFASFCAQYAIGKMAAGIHASHNAVSTPLATALPEHVYKRAATASTIGRTMRKDGIISPTTGGSVPKTLIATASPARRRSLAAS